MEDVISKVFEPLFGGRKPTSKTPSENLPQQKSPIPVKPKANTKAAPYGARFPTTTQPPRGKHPRGALIPPGTNTLAGIIANLGEENKKKLQIFAVIALILVAALAAYLWHADKKNKKVKRAVKAIDKDVKMLKRLQKKRRMFKRSK